MRLPLLLQESLQLWSVAGALLICGSTLTVALLEQRRVAAAELARCALAADGSENGLDRGPERAIMLAAPASPWSHHRNASAGNASAGHAAG